MGGPFRARERKEVIYRYLAQKKTPTHEDPHRTLGIGLR